jgi:hypothetical protein
MKLLVMQLSYLLTSSLFDPNILLNTQFSNTLSVCFFSNVKTQFPTREESQTKL